MWQKNQTILTKLGTIFLLIYALIIQQPTTGVDFMPKNISLASIENDLTSDDIYNYKKGKLKVAVENPIKKPEPQVASIAIPKQTPTPTEPPIIVEEKEEPVEVQETNVTGAIQKYAQEYNVDANVMIAIATCESGLSETAVNGQYAGIFQFHPSTWQSNRRAMGEDDSTSLRFNAEESAKTAAFKMSRDGYGAWPECSKKALLAER